MDTNAQAKSGFKTFVTTLGISLVVFSVAYYFLTSLSGGTPDAETFESKKDTSLADSTSVEPSVFGVINTRPTPTVTQPAVLAGADTTETTESTIPATGSDTLAGTMIGVSALSVAAYMVFVGPRKIALKAFEKDATK